MICMNDLVFFLNLITYFCMIRWDVIDLVFFFCYMKYSAISVDTNRKLVLHFFVIFFCHISGDKVRLERIRVSGEFFFNEATKKEEKGK